LENVSIVAGNYTNTPNNVDLESGFTITATNSYRIAIPLSGNINVCATCPITSLTLPAGAFQYINENEVTGNITLTITGNLTSETGEIGLNEFASPHTVLIKPGSGTTPIISGSSATNIPLIKFNGADRVTIDGSNTVGGITGT
jgi:hypothetical protein